MTEIKEDVPSDKEPAAEDVTQIMAEIKEDVPSDEEPAEEDVNHQLYDACKRGDEEAVTSLLPKIININWKNDDKGKNTFLHAAAYYGHLPVAKLLLDNHADLHMKNEDDITVLHMAGYSGNIDLMNYLIEKGSLVTAKDKDDATVLHSAVAGGCSIKVLNYLIDKGVPLAAKNKDDGTVLHAAAAGGCSIEVLSYLIDKRVPLAAKNKYDSTVLHSAAYGGCSIEVLNYLIDKGVPLEAKDKDDWTILHFACGGGHWDTIQYLLKKEFSLYDKDKSGRTPLDILKQESDDNEEETERRRKCLQLLQTNDDINHKVDSTPTSDSSSVKSDPEEDVKSKTETDSQDQPAQIIDYKPFLEKAAAEGTVKTRRTNLGLSGASGTGKTSTLRLLTDQEPEYTHNSTPVLQPMELFKDNSPHSEDEEEESSSDLDTDDSDKEQPEHEPAPTVRTTKRYLLIANKHKWSFATRNALFHRLANSVFELAHTPEKSNLKKKSKGSMMKKGMFYPFRSLKQSSSHSAAATAIDGPPLKRRKMLTMSFDDLQAAKEILAFIESNKDLKDLGITHFVNVNDTGGQAAFIDIAPALMRYNSINLVLIKLDEPLNDKAKFFYSVRGKRVGTEKRQITTKSLVIAMFSSKMKIQKPQVEGLEYSENCGKPQFIVLGTHYDKYKQLKGQHEKLELKDKELLECLRDFEDVLIANGDKVIFPLNTLARDKRSLKLAAKIRKLVTKCYVEAEVPTRWYIFHVAINEIKGSKENKDIIEFSKLLEIGSLIKIFEEELKAALQYFHDLTLCLYYPNVLPDVVFATPQCLFDKLSEIIAVSLGKCDCGIDFEAKKRLQNKGLFEKELLKQLPKGFVDGLFTPEDFLKLMEHLFIASHMPGTDTYFMPCVLETAENPLDKLPPSMVEPLLFTWNGSVPNGLFPSLIMSLKNYKATAFEMAHRIKQYRNKITLSCPGLACLITLFEYPSFIGVTHNSNYTERSLKVHKSILNGMNSVVKRFNWTPSTAFPEEAYLCKIGECNVEYSHLCYSDMEQLQLFCSESYLTEIQTEAYLSWYNKKGITNASSSIFQEKPLLKDAFSLLQEKSSKWDDIGRAFNVSLNDREELRTDTLLSNNARLERVLNVWLETSCHTQTTWLEFRNILSETLGFKVTARQVQTFLEKEQLNSTD